VVISEYTDLLSLDGSRYHIADSAAPIKNTCGEVIGAILVFRDVTEEYDKRDRLRNSTLALEYASGLARFAAFRLEPDTHLLEGSKLLPELFPIENGGGIMKEQWIYPEDLDKFVKAKKRLLDGKDDVICIDYRSSYLGEMRYFRLKATLDKNITKGIAIIGVVQDVTDLNSSIQNEKVVNTCLEALFKGENMDEAVRQVLREICIHMGADRCYILQYHPEDTTVSVAAEYAAQGILPLILACPQQPLATRDMWYQRLLHHEFLVYPDISLPKSRRELGMWSSFVEQYHLYSCFISGIYLDDSLWGNFGLTYDRKPHDFSDLNLTFLHAATHLIELILQRKFAQEQLFAALLEAQRANKAKSYFIASVSHEIRTPLNAVIGFSELLRDEELDRKTQKDYLDSIVYSGNALLQLINDVLDLSKLEAGQMTIMPGITDIRELCRDVMKVFQNHATEKNLKLCLKMEDLPLLSVDTLRIRQILFNLIGNAVKFTEKGNITVSAEFAFSLENAGTLRLGVRDTGIGISPADCKNLATPFVQLSGMRGTHAANNGTGLGLAISKRMAEAMNGELFIESELGLGSFFYVMLYDVKVEKTPLPEVSQKEEVLTFPSSLSVLVVDDVEMNLKVLQAMLSNAGIKEVAWATSAEKALTLLRSRRFDIVLTDIWMPGMNGVELADEIKKDPSLAQIPVIALTADMEVNSSFSMEHFSGILLKPVTVDKLKSMLSSSVK